MNDERIPQYAITELDGKSQLPSGLQNTGEVEECLLFVVSYLYTIKSGQTFNLQFPYASIDEANASASHLISMGREFVSIRRSYGVRVYE